MSAALPSLVWRAFAAPKAGNAPTEFEDAFAGDPEFGRFAVADGATESVFAGTWAKLLADGCVSQRGPWSGWLPTARRQWAEQCQREDMPWYLEEKYAEGAFAALLAVWFRGPDRWHAAAVGDACLFHVRNHELLRAFPVRHSRDFGNRPMLLGSHDPGRSKRIKRRRLQSDWHAGDHLLLATDALAHWFLKEAEQGRRPWTELLRLETNDEFAAWLECRRNENEIRNDDVTLICITPKGFDLKAQGRAAHPGFGMNPG